MSQSDQRLAASTSNVRTEAQPQTNQVSASGGCVPGPKSASPGNTASRVLDVNRPWLDKGLQAIWQQETNHKEREWVCKRLEFFVGSRRDDVSHITEAQVFEYLDWQVKHGQKDWQVLQSLSAISYLLEYGCGRRECMFSALREKWLERQGKALATSGAGRDDVSTFRLDEKTIAGRLGRRLRVLHYSRRTEEAYAGWWLRFQKFTGQRVEDWLGSEEVRRDSSAGLPPCVISSLCARCS